MLYYGIFLRFRVGGNGYIIKDLYLKIIKHLEQDLKMLIEVDVLGQSFVTLSPYIMFGLIALVLCAMKKWMPGFRTYGGKNSQTGINKRLADSIDDLYKDKEFVKDFVKILEKQSNLEIIVDKAQTRFYKDSYLRGTRKRSARLDSLDWQKIIRTMINGEGFHPGAGRIAREVIKTNGYKMFSKKHEFSAEDDMDMLAVMYYIVTRPDFADTAERYLYAAARSGSNVLVPALPSTAFDSPKAG